MTGSRLDIGLELIWVTRDGAVVLAELWELYVSSPLPKGDARYALVGLGERLRYHTGRIKSARPVRNRDLESGPT